jgi:hypothetical protein
MASQKQMQNRLVSKKKDLKKITQDMSIAVKDKKKILLRKLTQEKVALKRSIGKLERQLFMEIKASNEKKTLSLQQDNV